MRLGGEDARRGHAERRQRDARLRELEWAATYLKTHEPRRGCRCAASCPACREYAIQAQKIGPEAVLELIAMVRR